jgi:hypothetical protein
MTYFADLTPYVYGIADDIDALNVGWLDAVHSFDVRAPSEELLDALWAFVRSPVAKTRGRHECELCPRDADYDERLRARMGGPRDLPWPEDRRSRSIWASRHGVELQLGTAEMRAYGEGGGGFAAPTLIYHYVAAHQYAPPDAFVRAVLDGPRPLTDAYRARLGDAG